MQEKQSKRQVITMLREKLLPEMLIILIIAGHWTFVESVNCCGLEEASHERAAKQKNPQDNVRHSYSRVVYWDFIFVVSMVSSLWGKNGGENFSRIQAVEPPSAQETAGERNGSMVQTETLQALHGKAAERHFIWLTNPRGKTHQLYGGKCRPTTRKTPQTFYCACNCWVLPTGHGGGWRNNNECELERYNFPPIWLLPASLERKKQQLKNKEKTLMSIRAAETFNSLVTMLPRVRNKEDSETLLVGL